MLHWDTLNAGANLFGEFQQKHFSVPARFLSFHPGQSHHFHPRHTFYKRKTCYDFWAQNQIISEILVEFNWPKNTSKKNWIPIYYKGNVRWNIFNEWRKPECPKQLFSWRARWCYVDRHQKLLKDTSFIILSIYCGPVSFSFTKFYFLPWNQ